MAQGTFISISVILEAGGNRYSPTGIQENSLISHLQFIEADSVVVHDFFSYDLSFFMTVSKEMHNIGYSGKSLADVSCSRVSITGQGSWIYFIVLYFTFIYGSCMRRLKSAHREKSICEKIS